MRGTRATDLKCDRRSVRLKGYDYATEGSYFVTVCTHGRASCLGSIQDSGIVLTEFGRIVQEQWNALPRRFPAITLDESVVMPNHVHGIVAVGAPLAGAPSRDKDSPSISARDGATVKVAPTLGRIIGAFKSICVQACLEWIAMHEPGRQLGPLWQRGYYEHVIRDELDLDRIRKYIAENPTREDESAEPAWLR